MSFNTKYQPDVTATGSQVGFESAGDDCQSIQGLEDDTYVKKWIDEMELEEGKVERESFNAGVNIKTYGEECQDSNYEVPGDQGTGVAQSVPQNFKCMEYPRNIQKELETEIQALANNCQIGNQTAVHDKRNVMQSSRNGFQPAHGLEDGNDMKRWIVEMHSDDTKFANEFVNKGVSNPIYFEDSQAPDIEAPFDKATNAPESVARSSEVLEDLHTRLEELDNEVKNVPRNCPVENQPALNDEPGIMDFLINESAITSSLVNDSDLHQLQTVLLTFNDENLLSPLPIYGSIDNNNFGSSTSNQPTAAQLPIAPFKIQSEQPTDFESTDEYLKSAMDKFYVAAYKRLNMARPTVRSESSSSDPVCDVGLLPESEDIKRKIMLNSDLLLILETEIKQGKDVNDDVFMEIFAIQFLDHLKFKYLCPCCESFFRTSQVYSQHFVRHGTKITCPYRCGSSFTRLSSLTRHLKTNHRCGSEMQNKEPGLFRCTE